MAPSDIADLVLSGRFGHNARIMPTIIGHMAPVLAARLGLGGSVIPPRLLLAGLLASALPDLDVISFKLGIDYGHALGHRGLSHSLLFALMVGGLGLVIAPLLKCGRSIAFVVLAGAVVAHIALDAMTSGGLGVALLWPLDETRYFLPWRPIRVSPLSPRAFMGGRGLTVLLSELLWVWLPFFSLAIAVLFTRKLARRGHVHACKTR